MLSYNLEYKLFNPLTTTRCVPIIENNNAKNEYKSVHSKGPTEALHFSCK